MSPALLWLVAGVAAAVADYGLGVGFGLVASLLLAGLGGLDPRRVASAAAAAQLATLLPAVYSHGRGGVITRDDVRVNAGVIAALSASSTAAAVAAAWLAAGLSPWGARLAYAAAMAVLAVVAAWLATRGWEAGGAGGGRGSSAVRAAIVFGAAAGAEKALTGGGYSLFMVAAQVAAGVDLRKAVALTPLAKLLPYSVVVAVYAATGHLEPRAALLLTAGGLAGLPLATRLLRRARPRGVALATSAASLAAAAAAVAHH